MDWSACRQLLENLEYLLNGTPLNYLVINHMGRTTAPPSRDPAALSQGPDHLHGEGLHADAPVRLPCGRSRVHQVKEGDTYSFGDHRHLCGSSMVHWPEAMVTFDTTNGVLFSAADFGSFIALDGKLFADEVNFDRTGSTRPAGTSPTSWASMTHPAAAGQGRRHPGPDPVYLPFMVPCGGRIWAAIRQVRQMEPL